ncbi:MAG: hypothetical protein M3Y51_00460 [Actinomycetota bacterium]|nr:hypothetical protein [Actinomycetota bacterium]
MSAPVLDETIPAVESGDRDRSRRAARPTEYAVFTAALTAVVAVLTRPWVGGWATPLVYDGDTLSDLAMFDAVGWTGSARGVAELGAPHGASWIDFPLGPDRMHLIGLRLLGLVTDDAMLQLNLYLLAGFLLVGLASFAVTRALGLTPLVAGTVSILFAIAPYHFDRIASGHMMLAAYYAVPLGVLLALWASTGAISRASPTGRRVAVVVCVVLVGSASAYYAMFSMLAILALGAVVAVRRASWRAVLMPVALTVAIGAVVGLNTVGTLLDARAAGANHEASLRAPSDSDTYALRPAQLLAGDDHLVGPVAEIGTRLGQVASPGEGTAPVGVVALVGLVGALFLTLRSTGRPVAPERAAEQSLLSRVTALAGVLTVAASIGSVGLLLASVGFGQIRVWSRMSIVLTFLGLVAAGVMLDRLMRTRWPRRDTMAPLLVCLVVVAVAVLDLGAAMPDRAEAAQARSVDVEAVAALEDLLESGDSVAQVPYLPFPAGVVGSGIPLYAHLGPWAAGGGALSWSAGGAQGRGGDWQQSWTMQPPEVMASGLAAAGFDALYVDRRDDGSTLRGTWTRTEDIVEALGPPDGETSDGSRQWYDLRPLRARLEREWGSDRVAMLGAGVVRPVGVTYDGAVDRLAAGDRVRWLRDDAAIVLRSEDGDRGELRVRFTVSGAEGTTVRIGHGGGTRRIVLGEDPTEVDMTVAPDGRDTRITISSDGDALDGVPPQFGEVHLELADLEVVDAEVDRWVREQSGLSDS